MKILIIKLGALGDFVQATTAFKALKNHYSHDHLSLLTTEPYKEFAKKLGYFNEIIIDSRPQWYQFPQFISLIKTIKRLNFDLVYDLQGVDRTRFYRKLLSQSIEWIGCHQDKNHPQDSFSRQFRKYGIKHHPLLDLKFLAEDIEISSLQRPYVLMVPGASNAHGGRKKWPERFYAELAYILMDKGYQPMIIGGPKESFPILFNHVPHAINLVGKTSFYQIIRLAMKAVFAVGNDTGPMLLAASGGCSTYTFYSQFNPFSQGGAKGMKNFPLESQNLEDLSVDKVVAYIYKNHPL